MSKMSGKKALLTGGGFALAAAVCITGAVLWSNIGPGQSGNEGEIISEATDRDESAALSRQEVIAQKRQELADKEGQYNETSIVLSDTTKERAERIANETGARLRMTKDGTFAVLYLPENVSVEDIYANEEYQDFLPDMDLDYYVQAQETDANGNEMSALRPDYDVTDPDYDMQSYLDYINLRDTWKTTKGQGTKIAVIDSGIDTDHPDFAGKISELSYNASKDRIVKDHDLSVIEDEQGHGTAVAGVIAAGMNNGEGITGIAPDAELVVIKCDCDENGKFVRSSDLVMGLAYAIECDADVVNMSFGTQESTALEKYVNLAYDSDIICVAAAGNDGSSMPVFPASYENVIGVGALAADGYTLADYSNYGDNSDLLAPGTTYTTRIGGGYGFDNGTSLASPVVAGAVALYLSKNPHTDFPTMNEMLKASCVDLGALGEDIRNGFGALDIHALICDEKGQITYEMLTSEVKNQTQYFVKGHTIQYMVEPDRDSIVLDGWFWDIDCTDECEYYTTVFSTDCTLYASWINEDEGTAYGYSTLNDGTVEIQKYYGKRRYLTIPSQIEGKTVSSIGAGAFADNQRLRSVILPRNLVSIGECAFENCSRISKIEFPDTVQMIGERAFCGCTGLRNAVIGEDSLLMSIEDEAFSMTGITDFVIPVNLSTLRNNVFYGSTELKKIAVMSGNTSFTVKNDALYDKTEKELLYYPAAKSGEYSVADGTTTIGANALAYSRCRTVELPASLSVIKENAFETSNVQNITIPDSVSTIENGAFSGSSLISINFGENSTLEAIQSSTFAFCQHLSSVSIPQSVTTIEGCAFANSGITEVDFHSGSRVSAFGGNAFSVTPLARIAIPDTVTSIGSGCFAFDDKLKTVVLSENSQCMTIGQSAFVNCSSLESFVIPNAVTKIGECAFYNSGLKEVSIGANISDLSNGVFSACHKLKRIDVSEQNTTLESVAGILYDEQCEILLMYPAGREGAYQLPDTTKQIAAYAFAEATLLTDIQLNDGLTEIGREAFIKCDGLEQVLFPSSLTSIGVEAFEKCKQLSSLTIPKKVINIGWSAFGGDYNLKTIDIEPESELSRIGSGAFANCGIESFTVPENVLTVGLGAFENCADLVTVTFEADSKLQSLSPDIFYGAGEIRQITFEEGSSLKRIDAHALDGLTKLQKITLKFCEHLEKIGNYSFKDCVTLSQVEIPISVTEIGRYAFAGCENLNEIRIPKSTEFIGRYAFYNTADMNVYFRSSTLPSDLEENWDADIQGYYVGTSDLVTSGDWKYALTEDD